MCCTEVSVTPVKQVTVDDILQNLPVAVTSSPLAVILPKDVTEHPNGDIEVTSDKHPDILGYERDKDNPRLFHRRWLDCPHRMQGVKQKGAFIDVTMMCHGQVPTFMKLVKPEQCAACPLAAKRKDQQ